MKKFLLAAILIIGIGVAGKYHEVEASEFNFSVHFELPENQQDKNKTYLDLLMQPNQKQEIPYTLRNDTDQEVIVDMSIHSATTNSNGVIEYGESLSEKDPSLKYDLKDLATIEDQVKVPPKSSVERKLVLQAPAEQVTGVIAGGVTFQEHVDETAQEQQKTVGVINKFSQVKAVLIQTNQEKVMPDLNLTKAAAKQSNVRNVIAVNLQNSQAAYMFGLTADVKIYKGQEKDPFLTLNKEEINMAPNTNFDLLVPLKGRTLASGIYRVEVNGQWQEQQWHLKTTFKISQKEATTLNDTDIDRASEATPNYWMWGAICMAILILIILGMFIYKKLCNKGEKK
ncbi:DUF916 and DUF3324 domain-containing protein [Enterococcus faecalis]